MMVNDNIWLVVDLPLWKMMEFVSWGYYSQYMESHKIDVPNHQPAVLKNSANSLKILVWVRFIFG